MKYSKLTLQLLVARELKIIKSNKNFWDTFFENIEILENYQNNEQFIKMYDHIKRKIDENEMIDGIVSVFDENFPVINGNVKNLSEKPFLLFYKGNLDLLEDLNKNVAVIGLTSPSDEIVEKEVQIVKKLISFGSVIVSGLALGCDAVAHQTTINNNGFTIAILPSNLDNIYPKQNRILAINIVNNNGLLITEYFNEPIDKYEAIKRLVDRDRLQAMFSKAIVLIASFKEGEGDSGARHAINYAIKYGLPIYCIDPKELKDSKNIMSLNQDLIESKKSTIIKEESIQKISNCSIEKLENYNRLLQKTKLL